MEEVDEAKGDEHNGDDEQDVPFVTNILCLKVLVERFDHKGAPHNHDALDNHPERDVVEQKRIEALLKHRGDQNGNTEHERYDAADERPAVRKAGFSLLDPKVDGADTACNHRDCDCPAEH